MASQADGLIVEPAVSAAKLARRLAPTARITPTAPFWSRVSVDSQNRAAWQRRVEIALPLAGPAAALVIELLLL